MNISVNANRCEPSPMRKFHLLAVEAKAAGKTIYHLNIVQPDIVTPEAYFAAIRRFDRATLAYAESPGAPFYETLGKGKNEVRIAYVLEQEKSSRAMDILAAGIKRYRSEIMGQ